MKHELAAYRCGRIDFAALYSRTRKEWTALAASLLRRYRCPPSVDVDDVVQVMLEAVHHFVPMWEEERGTPLKAFVVFNSCDKAVKWIHQQRRAYKRDGKSPSAFDIPLSCLGLDEYGERRLMDRAAADDEPAQHVELERRQAVARRASKMRDGLNRYVLHQLAEKGDLEAVVENVQSNALLRLAYRIEPTHVRRAVRRALEQSLQETP